MAREDDTIFVDDNRIDKAKLQDAFFNLTNLFF